MILRGSDNTELKDLMELAAEIGFTSAHPLNMDALVFRPEVRSMCASDKCRSYGSTWSCPPAVGSLESIRAKAADYTRGILVQTTEATDGSFDYDSMQRAARDHQRNFDTLVRQIRLLAADCLPMGAGTCTRCRKCTYPDRPCRHPDRMTPSMEAYGLVVSEVCRDSGLRYNYGDNTITYTSCILLK